MRIEALKIKETTLENFHGLQFLFAPGVALREVQGRNSMVEVVVGKEVRFDQGKAPQPVRFGGYEKARISRYTDGTFDYEEVIMLDNKDFINPVLNHVNELVLHDAFLHEHHVKRRIEVFESAALPDLEKAMIDVIRKEGLKVDPRIGSQSQISHFFGIIISIKDADRKLEIQIVDVVRHIVEEAKTQGLR